MTKVFANTIPNRCGRWIALATIKFPKTLVTNYLFRSCASSYLPIEYLSNINTTFTLPYKHA